MEVNGGIQSLGSKKASGGILWSISVLLKESSQGTYSMNQDSTPPCIQFRERGRQKHQRKNDFNPLDIISEQRLSRGHFLDPL